MLLAGVLARTFTRVDLPGTVVRAVAHLAFGAAAWGLHAVWDGPFAVAAGIVAAMFLVNALGARWSRNRVRY